jgi:hypothetical protein
MRSDYKARYLENLEIMPSFGLQTQMCLQFLIQCDETTPLVTILQARNLKSKIIRSSHVRD